MLDMYTMRAQVICVSRLVTSCVLKLHRCIWWLWLWCGAWHRVLCTMDL